MDSLKDAPVLCRLTRSKTPRISRVPVDKATESVKKCFDHDFNGVNEYFPYEVPKKLLNLKVNIIQIVGDSGTGKSTLLEAFKKAGWHYPNKTYDNSMSVISNFADDLDYGTCALNSVGLSSIPRWLRPRNVLSNGEGFRADLALNIDSYVMIDEYASVINPESAMSASNGVQRFIRSKNYKNVILCGCRSEVVPFVKPDILIDTDVGIVYDLRDKNLRDKLLKKALTSPSSKCAETRSGRSGKYSLRITI